MLFLKCMKGTITLHFIEETCKVLLEDYMSFQGCEKIKAIKNLR